MDTEWETAFVRSLRLHLGGAERSGQLAVEHVEVVDGEIVTVLRVPADPTAPRHGRVVDVAWLRPLFVPDRAGGVADAWFLSLYPPGRPDPADLVDGVHWFGGRTPRAWNGAGQLLRVHLEGWWVVENRQHLVPGAVLRGLGLRAVCEPVEPARGPDGLRPLAGPYVNRFGAVPHGYQVTGVLDRAHDIPVTGVASEAVLTAGGVQVVAELAAPASTVPPVGGRMTTRALLLGFSHHETDDVVGPDVRRDWTVHELLPEVPTEHDRVVVLSPWPGRSPNPEPAG